MTECLTTTSRGRLANLIALNFNSSPVLDKSDHNSESDPVRKLPCLQVPRMVLIETDKT